MQRGTWLLGFSRTCRHSRPNEDYEHVGHPPLAHAIDPIGPVVFAETLLRTSSLQHTVITPSEASRKRRLWRRRTPGDSVLVHACWMLRCVAIGPDGIR